MFEPKETENEYLLQVQKNIEENRKMLMTLGFQPFTPAPPTPVAKVKRSYSYSPNKYKKAKITSTIIRRSPRLRSSPYQFPKDIASVVLGLTDSCVVYMNRDIQEEEANESDTESDKPRTKIRRILNRTSVQMQEITEDDLKRIAQTSTGKIYSHDGTTCHQCRQKTIDQKTFCKSSTCYGVRGQFCGPCLNNRYGESVAEALKNPEWKCPPCRNMCNCSICRNNAGKRPTGQLYPFAQSHGYKCVQELLEKENEL